MLWNINIQGRLEIGMNDARKVLTIHEIVRKLYFSFLNSFTKIQCFLIRHK